MSTRFEWAIFYPELADKILLYKNNRGELLSIIAGIFDRTGMKNYVKREIDDVCPFTVMGMFNKGISNANRIAILKEFARIFEVTVPVPESFDGIPVLNNMMSLFYGDKGWDGGRLGHTAGAEGYDADIHIEKLWELFEVAIVNADNPDVDTKQIFIKTFNFVVSQPLSKWMITCGLFWIRPFNYISLDANMKAYLNNNLSMGYKFNKLPSGGDYLDLCDKVKNKLQNIKGINSLPELSHDAWLRNREPDSTSYWLGGAKYGENSEIDMSQAFIENGVYGIGFRADISELIMDQTKFNDWIDNLPEERAKKAFTLFAQMKPGDKIAMKSAFAKGKVSLLRIKAIGTVSGTLETDYKYDEKLAHTIPVEWEAVDPYYDLELGGYLRTIHKVTKQQDIEKIFYEKRNYLRDGFVNEKEQQAAFRQWYTENGGSVNSATTISTAIGRARLKDGRAVFSIANFDELNSIISAEGLDGYFEARDGDYSKIGIIFDIEANVQSDDLKNGIKFYLRFLKSGMKVSLKEWAIKILKDAQEPMTHIEIWEYGVSKGWDNDLSSVGETPWQSIYALLSNYRDGSPNPDKRIKIIESEQRRKFVISNDDSAAETILEESSIICEKYDKENFLAEVYIDGDEYDDIVALLDRKKNIILQGAPGVGKSYMAKRLAYSIIGCRDINKVEMVQFHQSYSYEDFIEGFRPIKSGGFELLPGIFKRFCNTAVKDERRKYFFIIDEINRGNLSKIMGELMLLIEHDKRGKEFEMPLTYSGEKFFVPENVYIIGMMNTADRSLAMIDYALRRRFSFVQVEPGFNNSEFEKYIKKDNESLGERILAEINALNADIRNDLGAGFQVGHSYFCNCDYIDAKWYESVLRYEIMPLLDEYWFDNEKQHSKWVKGLLSDEKNPN